VNEFGVRKAYSQIVANIEATTADEAARRRQRPKRVLVVDDPDPTVDNKVCRCRLPKCVAEFIVAQCALSLEIVEKLDVVSLKIIRLTFPGSQISIGESLEFNAGL
jgi:hypothetical protein